ncbi:MAG: glycosyltransferase family 9 protein [Chitinophagaceae bacterium]|nr:glycosyltransferase family 9 protein [Chitinophagaceae bacterium]
MNVNAMRTIDKWVGVPLCFLASVLSRIRNLFTTTKRIPNTQRTLFIELSEMGSAVIVDPAMRKLKREANAELFFAIFKDNAKSLEILNTVPDENIFKMNSSNLLALGMDVFRFMSWCRKKKITCVIDLELFSRFTALLSFLSGARTRIGFASFHDEGLYRGSMINFPVRYNAHVHIAVNFVSLINRAMNKFYNPYATVPLEEGDLYLERADVHPARIAKVRAKIKELYPAWRHEKVILLNANASDMLPQRRWQQENFAAVAKQLLSNFRDIIIVATGAPSERNYVQKVIDMASEPRFVNSAGVFKFDELVPLYSVSTLMLTNDSGPAHFASVTPLKVFVLFGPETPALYGPLGGNAEPFYLKLPCSPCVSAANHRKTTCETRPCITTISPQHVGGRLQEWLAEQGTI